MRGNYVLRPEGDLDIAAVPHLEGQVREAIDRHHPETLLVDLSGVSFMDCSGIGLLVWAHRQQRADGGRLVIANASGPARKILTLTAAEAGLEVELRPVGDRRHGLSLMEDE